MLTHKNAPKQGAEDHHQRRRNSSHAEITALRPAGRLVVAETFEQARAAAYLVKPTTTVERAPSTCSAMPGEALVPEAATATAADSAHGRFRRCVRRRAGARST